MAHSTPPRWPRWPCWAPRAALTRERFETAAGLFGQALEHAPDDPRSLTGRARSLLALGDHAAAGAALRKRLSLSEPDPESALHRTLLGRCLEHTGEHREALVEYRAALEASPLQEEALEACARILEREGRYEEGIAALERWARAAPDGPTRAERLLRAADWEGRQGDAQRAEEHLQRALAADPGQSRAWIDLAELLLATGRPEETIEATDRGAAAARCDSELATLAELQGKALEERGERSPAAERFGWAWDCDPCRADAALAQARLLRGFGEWQQAAEVLSRFAGQHPGSEEPALAEVFEQLGRLQAGPLEDLAGAVLSYRRAIELAPERLEARASLAELLSHRPGDRDEALEQLRAVLAADPLHAGCLRAALRLARASSSPQRAAKGIALMRALGIASPYESGESADSPAVWAGPEPALREPHHEALRKLASEASRELAEALGGTHAREDAVASKPGPAALRERMLLLQGELSAPALLACSEDDARQALRLLVELLLEPESVRGDGQLVNALSAALPRRRRRKLRRLLPPGATARDFADFDFGAWRQELAALAGAAMLQRREAELEPLLGALTATPGEAPDGGGAPLGPRISADPVAHALVRRLVETWLEEL